MLPLPSREGKLPPYAICTEEAMSKLKDTPLIDRPREKFLKKGPDALSKSELLALVLGSGIQGTNARQLAEKVLRKAGAEFLDLDTNVLLSVKGIGRAKALQIISAVELVKRFHAESKPQDNIILSAQDALSLTSEIKNQKKEHLLCLYLNARNALLKKELISIGTLDRSIVHPREIFGPAVELRAAGIILVHNHPSGDVTLSKQDEEVVSSLIEAGKIMGINIIDFIVVSGETSQSIAATQKNQDTGNLYIADGSQTSLFSFLAVDKPVYSSTIKIAQKMKPSREEKIDGQFQLQNRRYLGNKYKLLGFIEDIVNEKCGEFNSFCDIFAGTGVVGARFNKGGVKIISNDILVSNYLPIKTFLGVSDVNIEKLRQKIESLNSLEAKYDNYFSTHFGNSYFTVENARKIGAIREKIDTLSDNEDERSIMITSLLYAADKVANTVGHYDAFRKSLDTVQRLRLLLPDISFKDNVNNEIYKKDANQLVREIGFDVLYIDPPYNSRQYSDAYHLLENLATWEKPPVHGIAKKMDRDHLKSEYCVKSAPETFADLIKHARCKHILVSYNNTGESKDGRSNARINDRQILNALKERGKVEIFERDYKAFSAGKSDGRGHTERVFYCRVDKQV